MAQKNKFYITTAIAYASGKPHIGNCYEIILSDSLARFKRREGFDVFFQTGTDEHGQKIEDKARAAGKAPKAFVDGIAADIRALWDMMNISYDKFIRTTDPRHIEEIQKIFKKFYEQGDIYKGAYKGHYCTPCESFWTDSQLVDGKCPDCGREVRYAEEEAYFFKMSKYADRLIKYYEDNPEFILPYSRKNEMINNFLKPGLQDLCVSRTSFNWGIPVDFDSKHVVYVWLDALSNYITGAGYNCGGESSPEYKKYWPADVHVIGKDIVRFHTIYWPIFLMALGEPLPKQVFGHPWLLQDGGKMSKSKGNVIYADDLIKFFGTDAVRYYVLSAMPFDNDGLITWELVSDTINSDLSNVLGNLVKRTVSMCNRYQSGIMKDCGASEPIDEALKATAEKLLPAVKEKLKEYKVSDALAEIFSLFRRANKYIDETTPWSLGSDETKKDRLSTVLYNLAESIIMGASALEPFMPETAAKIVAEFGAQLRPFDSFRFGLYPNGSKVAEEPSTIFPRGVTAEILAKVEAMYAERTPAAPHKEEIKAVKEPLPEIGIDDFAKVELKVGKIIACERLQKSEKLLKSTIDMGGSVRTVLSGIAKYYTPKQLIGKNVIVVANLKPAKLCGVVSEGMILCADDGEKLSVLTLDRELPSGSGVS